MGIGLELFFVMGLVVDSRSYSIPTFEFRCTILDRLCSKLEARDLIFDVSWFGVYFLTWDVRCSMPDVRYLLEAWSWTFGCRLEMFQVRISMFDVWISIFDVRCSSFDLRRSMLFVCLFGTSLKRWSIQGDFIHHISHILYDSLC